MTVDAPLDEANARFWDMLCGWSMAQAIGITGDEREDLARFDQAYLAYYPYLAPYFEERLAGRRVLEVGLGFGTLGQLLAERGAEYHGVDIAAEPVSLMRRRLEMSGLGDPARVVQASALALPHDDTSFDDVVSIGCLHHTGDLQRAIDEVHRVLKPGGTATVMLYYRHSVRQLVQPLRAVVSTDWRRAFAERVQRALRPGSRGRLGPAHGVRQPSRRSGALRPFREGAGGGRGTSRSTWSAAEPSSASGSSTTPRG